MRWRLEYSPPGENQTWLTYHIKAKTREKAAEKLAKRFNFQLHDGDGKPFYLTRRENGMHRYGLLFIYQENTHVSRNNQKAI